MRRLISSAHGRKSLADWTESLPPEVRRPLLDGLTPNASAALPYLFEFWARPHHQLPPDGDWTTWLVMGGRGSGKTRAGAEWVRSQVEGATPEEPGVARRVALVAETWAQAREIMVFGDSGIMSCTPPDRKPRFIATRRTLMWRNGAQAQLYSAADPESLRGPQFDCAWSDELAKWRRARTAWDMLQLGLRLGARPRQIVTTTPRAMALLREIRDAPSTVTTAAATDENALALPASFLGEIVAKFRGTTQGREELDGELLGSAPGALFTRERIDSARVREAPPLDRIVVGVDPPTTGGARSDACGVVVAGRAADLFYVLADCSVGQATPARWAAAAVTAWRTHGAARIVAETNQGGDMVAEVIRNIDPDAPVAQVRATAGKSARAEPVAMLYEQGRVRHVGLHPALEDQLCAFGEGGGSPDRVDALVWAVTDLMQGPAPRVRRL
jgi:phage terminase large subunit-like protein